MINLNCVFIFPFLLFPTRHNIILEIIQNDKTSFTKNNNDYFRITDITFFRRLGLACIDQNACLQWAIIIEFIWVHEVQFVGTCV